MNNFTRCRAVEAKSREILQPFFKGFAKGQPIHFTDGDNKFDKRYQERGIDLIISNSIFGPQTFELKAEEKWTGNLFIEVWSNRSRGTPGWFYKCQARYLLYHFLYKEFTGNDVAYLIGFRALKRWLLEEDEYGLSRLSSFELKEQTKCEQPNDAWGRCIPIGAIRQAASGLIKLEPPDYPLVSEDD